LESLHGRFECAEPDPHGGPRALCGRGVSCFVVSF
jgi:hypothetical protein